ncbi:MAG TPA: hypothetical protein VGE74_06660 [Gemmata sp.]
MAVSVMVRRAAVVLLVAVIGFAALPGCGSSAPSKPGDKKEEPKATPKPDDKTGAKKDDKTGGSPVEPKTTLGPVEKDAEAAATAFLMDLGQGRAKADVLSPALLDAVGKPWELPDDVAAKLSRSAAERWLRAVGEGRAFTPSLDRKQAGDAVYIRGSLQTPGGYSLRLVKVGGAWKVDWLSLSSAVNPKEIITAPTADEAFQEFAASAFAELLADGTGMDPKLRAPILARGLVPALRAAWAPPFEGDTLAGYDYNSGKLTRKASEYGGGASAFSVSRAGDATYTVELTKPAGKQVITVKLAKGSTPGEWLVSEVTEKG